MSRVLIIEDDELLGQGMSRHLEAAGFGTTWVARGDKGLTRLRFDAQDVCILDLMIPGMDGWALIEAVRSEGITTPIIVVSARGTQHDRVHVLRIGADDYLVKPVSIQELVARVEVAARRGSRRPDVQRGTPVEVEELRIDPATFQAYVNGQSVDLTPTEFRLLYLLAIEHGRVLTRDEILQRGWGRPATRRDRTVDGFVRRLREKIDQHSIRHDFIHTRYGVGYKFEAIPKRARPVEAPHEREATAS
jgi:two-component system response regulator BaeR